MGNKTSKTQDTSCLPFGKSGLPKLKLTLAVLGLDNAGKTSTVLTLAKEPIENLMPSVGFESKEINIQGNLVTLYDLGGGQKIRGIWKNYLAEVHGVVYVIDAADSPRLEEAAKEFEKLCSNPLVAGKPILVLANKSDLPDALTQYEVTETMKLEETVNKYKVPTNIQQSTIKDIKTVMYGMEWLYMCIAGDYETLNQRVVSDTRTEQDRLKREKREKHERIKKLRAQREADEAENGEDQGDGQMNGDPFKNLGKHLKDKEESDKLTSEGKAASKNNTPESSPSHSAGDHSDHCTVYDDYAQVIPKSLRERKVDRVPSPLPAGFGDHLPPSRLPPLSSSLPLRSLESISSVDVPGEEKKKRRKKKKGRINPNNTGNHEGIATSSSEHLFTASDSYNDTDPIKRSTPPFFNSPGGLQSVTEEAQEET